MTMAASDLHVLSLLPSDPRRKLEARTKYGPFLTALGRRVQQVSVLDTNLTGWERAWGLLRTFVPDRSRWQERFYQHPAIFQARSRQLARQLTDWRGPRLDVSLQFGTLFDAAWQPAGPPVVLYCDYTARLAARDPIDARSPFTAGERAELFALETRAYQRAAHVFAWSRRVQTSLMQEYGLPAEQVTVIGAGVGIEPLPDLGAPLDLPPRLLFIGKDFLRKGGDILLRAFAEVRRAMPSARLDVVTRQAIPAGLPRDGVTVHPPAWDRVRVLALLRAADGLVLPSRLETWGDVLLEAMAYGVPCVGVTGRSMDEIIVPEETGLLVPPDDVAALAAALLRLLADPETRRAWGRAGRRRVEQFFTWPQVVERMLPELIQAARRGVGV